jgi:hypothetical protein
MIGAGFLKPSNPVMQNLDVPKDQTVSRKLSD